MRSGRPAISPSYARSGLRLGRGKLAYIFVLRRAINERDAERGTTFRFLLGRGPFGSPCNLLRRANVERFETARCLRCGFLEGLCVYCQRCGYTLLVLPVLLRVLARAPDAELRDTRCLSLGRLLAYRPLCGYTFFFPPELSLSCVRMRLPVISPRHALCLLLGLVDSRGNIRIDLPAFDSFRGVLARDDLCGCALP